MKLWIQATVVALALSVGLPAFAQRVFVNGTDVTRAGLANRSFQQVSEVLFDGDGNVHILAPSWTIQVAVPAGESPRDPSAMALYAGGPYWLITIPDRAETLNQVVRVHVNDYLVRTIQPGDPQLVLDVSGWFQLGENVVRFTSDPLGPATAGDGSLKVIVGRGQRQQGAIQLDRTVGMFERTSVGPSTASAEFRHMVERPPGTGVGASGASSPPSGVSGGGAGAGSGAAPSVGPATAVPPPDAMTRPVPPASPVVAPRPPVPPPPGR